MDDPVAVWASVRQRKHACWRALAWGPVVLVVAVSIRRVLLVAAGSVVMFVRNPSLDQPTLIR